MTCVATMQSHFSSTERQDQSSPMEPTGRTFDPTRCLFCPTKTSSLESNTTHMQKNHGFLVPEQDRLQVDLETMLCYLDLVISGYNQCIYCDITRHTSEAARQHMIGKGHCKMDILSQDSEFGEFYHQKNIKQLGEQEGVRSRTPATQHLVQSRRTPAATKAISRRPSPSKSVSTGTPEYSSDNRSLQTMRSSEKRELALGNQLAQIRASDRSALMHMTSSQQRTQLSLVKTQIQKSRRAQQAMENRLQRAGNKTLMKHFVSDVPGPKNG